MMKIVRK